MSAQDLEPRWDVAISFAGKDRDIAREVRLRLEARGLSVYHDEAARAETVGENLFVRLREIYFRQARCCVAIISKDYVAGGWPKFELQVAQERALIDDGYLLPIRLDETDVPGLPRSLGYASMADLDAVAERAASRSRLDKAGQATGVTAAPARQPPKPAPADSGGDSSFERHVGQDILEISDSELVARCRALPEIRDKWSAWRLARDLARHLGWNTKLETSTPYTCWRSGRQVFLSMLPGVLTSAQRTLEFKLAGEVLFLVAQWRSSDQIWGRFSYEEYHDAVQGFMVDRSGLDAGREGSILALEKRGASFGFPVVPQPGEPETLGGWQVEEPEAIPFDWDRNPRLGDPRLGVWVDAHHMPSGAVVLTFMLYGSWTNAALYAFRDSLEILLPDRHGLYMCGPGAMRVTVLLATADASGLGRVDEESVEATTDAVHLSLAYACAAQDDVPTSPLNPGIAIPRPLGREQVSLHEALEALGSREFPHLSDDWAPSDAEWLKPRHSLQNRVNLARRFNFRDVSSPTREREYIAALEARLAH